MPILNELDIELPAIFILRALTNPDPLWLQSGGWRQEDFLEVQAAAARLAAAHGNRFWAGINVPDGATFPYIEFSGRTDRNGCTTFQLPRDFTGRKRAVYTVRRFDKYDSGRGSFSPARATYNDLRRCLCGVGETPIQAGGAVIGRVVETAWFDDHRASYRDEVSAAAVTELGIVVQITYEHNGA